MPKITMCRGLPASGKSTWAKAQVTVSCGQTKRVNMDLLREMLDAGEWSKQNECFMQEQREILIRNILAAKKNVIVDDVNLHPKHEALLRQIAQETKSTFAIQDFTDVSVEECIRRDLQRPVSVGEKVIRKFYKDFLFEAPGLISPPEWVGGAPRAIIVDIDGTVARMVSRGPHEYHKVSEDEPIQPVINIVREWAMNNIHSGYSKLIFCSGRPELCRQDTEEWVKTHVLKGLGLTDREWMLLMRADYLEDPRSDAKKRDFRKDVIVKRELFDAHVKGKYNIQFVLDDRDQVVEGWRALGLTCLQVAPGDF